MDKYKASKKFDMVIPFKELIKHNKTCKVDLKSKHHFETYSGVLIYVSYPGAKEKFSVHLGVDESGIMYEGDYGCQDTFPEIPIEEGLRILTTYKQIVEAASDLELAFMRSKLNDVNVEIKINRMCL